MRASRVTTDEQRKLIMECRTSGLSDHQWCLEHDIKSGTFYNWVKRLRQKGCTDLPEACRSNTSSNPIPQQEVVKVEIQKPPAQTIVPDQELSSFESKTCLEITFGCTNIKIPNGTDPKLLTTVLQVIARSSC